MEKGPRSATLSAIERAMLEALDKLTLLFSFQADGLDMHEAYEITRMLSHTAKTISNRLEYVQRLSKRAEYATID